MTQFVCWILLLQMLNISIFPIDLNQSKFGSIVIKEDTAL